MNGDTQFIETSQALGQGPFEMRVGREFLVAAWELCLRTMTLGEKARFICSSRLGVGSEKLIKVLREEAAAAQARAAGEKAIEEQPCYCTMGMEKMYTEHPDLMSMNVEQSKEFVLEFEMASFECADSFEKEDWEMSHEERWQNLPVAKEEGNAFFKQQEYRLAGEKYELMLTHCETLELHPQEYPVATLIPFVVSAHLNLAACFLKLDDYIPVVDNCTKALEREPGNVKAHYRRGVALARRGLSLEAAEKDFKQVLKLDPANSDAKKELKLLSKQLKVASQKEKYMFGSFFKDSKQGAGFYADVPTPAPEHQKASSKSEVETIVDAMEMGPMKARSEYLLKQKEAAEREQRELQEQLAQIQLLKQQQQQGV